MTLEKILEGESKNLEFKVQRPMTKKLTRKLGLLTKKLTKKLKILAKKLTKKLFSI